MARMKKVFFQRKVPSWMWQYVYVHKLICESSLSPAIAKSIIYASRYVMTMMDTWMVRVSAPQKILKSYSHISRLGMWTMCFHIAKDYFIGLFFEDILR